MYHETQRRNHFFLGYCSHLVLFLGWSLHSLFSWGLHTLFLPYWVVPCCAHLLLDSARTPCLGWVMFYTCSQVVLHTLALGFCTARACSIGWLRKHLLFWVVLFCTHLFLGSISRACRYVSSATPLSPMAWWAHALRWYPLSHAPSFRMAVCRDKQTEDTRRGIVQTRGGTAKNRRFSAGQASLNLKECGTRMIGHRHVHKCAYVCLLGVVQPLP